MAEVNVADYLSDKIVSKGIKFIKKLDRLDILFDKNEVFINDITYNLHKRKKLKLHPIHRALLYADQRNLDYWFERVLKKYKKYLSN